MNTHPLLRSVRFAALGSGIFLGGVLLSTDTSASTIVRFETTVGDIDVRLYDTATPNSIANFLNYVTTDRYDGTFFHRVPKVPGTSVSADFVVQGGGFHLNNSIFAATGITTDPPIGDEPGLTNTRKTLAFAKNSLGATSQWFFNIGDNSSLDDQDFTVFGHVINNTMSVVNTINGLPIFGASLAENAPGEDFDEVPVFDVQTVLDQVDITANDTPVVTTITVLNFADGDYNFDGSVDNDDYGVLVAQLGSTIRIADNPNPAVETFAEADGNADGVVDGADFTVWKNAVGLIDGDYNADGFVSQGDLDLVLLNWGDGVLPAGFNPGGLTAGPFDGLISQNELDGVLLNWGNGTPPTVAVPEPAAATLLGLGGIALLRRRK